MQRQSILPTSDNKRVFRKLTRRETSIAIVFFAALLLGLWLPTRIIVSTSASLEHRVFFMTTPNITRIRNGDYLVFNHDDTAYVRPGLHRHDQRYIKKVGCSPGQTLKKEDNNKFLCEETVIGEALQQDSRGRDLPQFSFSGEVPDNNYFMVGAHPRSFDSKYFGFIHADEIIHTALPLW